MSGAAIENNIGVLPSLFDTFWAFCHTGHNKRVNSSVEYWLERARRDLSNGGVYLEAQVSWRAQREIFACGGGAICSQRGQISALGLPGAPLIARRCSAIAPEHFATISGHVGSAAGDLALRPPSPCPCFRPQPPTRHSQARLAMRFALPSPQRSPTPHPSFSCDGHSPCCRRRRRRSSSRVQQ